MSWQPLSELVLEARKPLIERRVPIGPSTTTREAIVATALSTWTPQQCADMPALVNIAGIALTMMERLVLHRWSKDAVDMVHMTDLHSLPDEPPRLLRHPFLLETRHPERGQMLFGSTPCLGAYRLSEDPSTWWLVGLTWPDSIRVARWTPSWAGQELEEGVAYDAHSPLIGDIEGLHAWGIEAARFAVIAGLLLDATGSPVTTEVPRVSNAARRRAERSASPSSESWAVRRVVLAGESARLSAGPSAASPTARDGRQPVEAEIRGHLKRQRHGPGGELRRWIWVEGYQARRWIASKPLRVDVRAN